MTDQTTPEPLTDDDLTAMRDRSQGIDCAREAYDSAADVPRLLGEVDRLRAELAASERTRIATLDVAAELTEDLAEARAGRVETTTHAIETEDRERAREALERHGMADRECVIGDDVSTPGPTVPGDGEFLTLAQAAGHLHDWARDLADGTRTDWPAGHPDIIRGIRAAADWLDARDRYETETRDARAARLREAGRRLGESFQQLGEAIRDGAAKARAAREAGLIGDTDA